MRVGIATDHGGFGLKEDLLARLRAAGHEVVDFGAHNLISDDDYPDFVIPLARAVAAGQVERGVAVCGSGVGASICANKIPGVRAGLIQDHFSARQGVEDIKIILQILQIRGVSRRRRIKAHDVIITDRVGDDCKWLAFHRHGKRLIPADVIDVVDESQILENTQGIRCTAQPECIEANRPNARDLWMVSMLD